ncbi:hypothetical protein GT755_21975 [Herbidospora sp. NEAU-GS84]|uniref:Uncharacterized protein n=1 Tax=Herbidospora solisilvae TaxID=2696284 RepID=A0A7C9N2C0_9ACTN|nr:MULTISPECIES: hypothetical protein [Herbidospora]NAS24350.1 hypothetical protein [Herbidospora solisilvae]GLX98405.1 hypothetical protein Hesp01_63550 [Herbidospora sp. NBRC 101105]
MSDPQVDPAGNTQAFRAFARNQEEAAQEAQQQESSRLPLYIALGVALVIVVAVVGYFAFVA